MTPFEWMYRGLEWFLPVHYRTVRRILRTICRDRQRFLLLDVGGCKSNYTINISCEVDIVDLPRESEIQKMLGLGLTDEMLATMRRRRSNIRSIRLEDITRTSLPDMTYDGVVSVEVIEHVPDDSAFVRQIHRVLKPGGAVIMTTPNGETKKNVNPDHVRHYTRAELESKLRECFDDVRVFYGVRQGWLHNEAIKGWGPQVKRPLTFVLAPYRLLLCLLANLLEGDSANLAGGTNQLLGVYL